MKIAVCINRTHDTRTDQWTTLRGEGRTAMNQAFGLALLGHEVDVIGICDKENVFYKLSFVENFDCNKYYDIILSRVPFFLIPDNYGHLLKLIDPTNDVNYIKSWRNQYPRTEFITLNSKAVSLLEAKGLSGVKYFPHLLPIPCLPGLTDQDFIPFNLDLKKEKIKVWVFINSWVGYHISVDVIILDVLRRLKNYHNLDLEVTMMRVGRESLSNTIPPEIAIMEKEFGAMSIYSDEMCYIDVLNSIIESDICITKGGHCYLGNCASEIVSLGKLMIYVTEFSPTTLDPAEMQMNDFFPLDNFVLGTTDPSSVIIDKVDKIISNPEECYNSMRDAQSTYSFPEWKEIVTNLINNLGI